jgi:hypothetical protein
MPARSVAFLPGRHTRQEIEAEIQQQIDWSLDQQYLRHVDRHPTELRSTDRLLYEYRFLEFVASHPRSTGASGPFTAGSADKA